jgi:hypothetical protein
MKYCYLVGIICCFIFSATGVAQQIERIEVSDGLLWQGKQFFPLTIRFYNNGTQDNGPVHLVSLSPTDVVGYNTEQAFLYPLNQSDGIVICTWSYTHGGITVYTKSTIEVISEAGLEEQLAGDDIGEKIEAIERLSEIKSPAAIKILCNTLQPENKLIHGAVLSALIRTGLPEAHRKLEEILYDPSTPDYLTDKILNAYRKYGEEKDIAVLEKWLKDGVSNDYRKQGESVIKEIKKRVESRKTEEEKKDESSK